MTRSWVFVSAMCSGCRSFPCICAAPRTVPCACGGTLSAVDTLEDKGRAHTLHVRSDLHQSWRDLRRERPTATPACDLSTSTARASAAAVGGRA